MSDVFEWAELPEAQHAKAAQYQDVAAKLKEKPGSWAIIGKSKSSGNLAQQVKSGRAASFRPRGAFQAAARKNDANDGYDIYARYVGENA